jgi:hypothetical protein
VNARSLAVIGRGGGGGLAGAARGAARSTDSGVGERLPLVEQARVGLADGLAEPLDDVVELLGLAGVGTVWRRRGSVAQVAQDEPSERARP